MAPRPRPPAPPSSAVQCHLATALFNAHGDASRTHPGAQAHSLLDQLNQLDQLRRPTPGSSSSTGA